MNKGGGQVIFHLHAHLVSGKDIATSFISGAIALAVGWERWLINYKVRVENIYLTCYHYAVFHDVFING